MRGFKIYPSIAFDKGSYPAFTGVKHFRGYFFRAIFNFDQFSISDI